MSVEPYVTREPDGRLEITLPDPLAEFYPVAPEVLVEFVDEHNRLVEWKAEAMAVLAEWDEVWRAAGHPGNLGTSKAAAVRALFEDVPTEPAYPQPELFS